MDQIFLAHGGGGGPSDVLAGIGPVLIGVVLIGYFVLLLASDRNRGRRELDDTPTAARQMFDGKYQWAGIPPESRG
ncbi:hypothetical protein C3Y87_12385 [Carbonactinospora thermoautotrophica]|uniref:Uncharacterized protein n=1 Tax=Carbonactinospora thermoautotrophica TaxID=1469144 RepID=A0A132N3U8_9ACTN|nr:hypothetical protein [Carbonactinospora thermoautotrophica]KWX04686.1 hypothetical protein TH66_05595 [Carbonactinospora thermoautotrophica]KWX06883.1 hypothetical protein TR74_20630 [Carbonactinospora thermoautotrophica]MCX9192196.1 hypothetical protein [Carbonactinospora thermoautotrophica]